MTNAVHVPGDDREQSACEGLENALVGLPGKGSAAWFTKGRAWAGWDGLEQVVEAGAGEE